MRALAQPFSAFNGHVEIHPRVCSSQCSGAPRCRRSEMETVLHGMQPESNERTQHEHGQCRPLI
jgi:hypothetical protein